MELVVGLAVVLAVELAEELAEELAVELVLARRFCTHPNCGCAYHHWPCPPCNSDNPTSTTVIALGT